MNLKVITLNLYLLGYHLTTDLIGNHLIQRMLSRFSLYHNLHEKLNEEGNRLLRELRLSHPIGTVHQMATQLYGQGVVAIEHKPFLERMVQVNGKWVGGD